MKKFFKLFILCMIFTFMSLISFAASLNVSWTSNTESDLLGYNIYDKIGNGENIKVGTLGVMSSPVFVISNVVDGTHVVSVTAFDTYSNESVPSDSVTVIVDTTPPLKPTKPMITITK